MAKLRERSSDYDLDLDALDDVSLHLQRTAHYLNYERRKFEQIETIIDNDLHIKQKYDIPIRKYSELDRQISSTKSVAFIKENMNLNNRDLLKIMEDSVYNIEIYKENIHILKQIKSDYQVDMQKLMDTKLDIKPTINVDIETYITNTDNKILNLDDYIKQEDSTIGYIKNEAKIKKTNYEDSIEKLYNELMGSEYIFKESNGNSKVIEETTEMNARINALKDKVKLEEELINFIQ